MRVHAANSINSSSCSANYVHELIQIVRNKQEDPLVRRYAADAIGVAICATLSRRTGESRSPERVRSGEGSSAQGGQLLDQMKKILEEYPQMKERENELKQERDRAQTRLINAQQDLNRIQEQLTNAQLERNQARGERDLAQRQLTNTQQERDQARQERDHFQRQLTDAREERDQARSELRDARQEHNRTREQLRNAQQDLNRTQEQLTNAQLELNRTQEQLTNAQLERNRAHLERDQAQLELRQMRTQEEQRKQRWDSLYDILMNAPGQPGRQDERGQSSRGDQRVNDALPTTREGMEQQLGQERRTQQELLERVLQLQERLQRTLRERGEDLPSNERLNELLRQKIWNVVSDHRLDEVLFPRQEHGELPSLRQRLRGLYLQTVSDYTSLRLSQEQIAGEFVDQLQEQIEEHNRPSQEWIDVSEDIQELVTGRRPDRTRH